MPNLLFRRVRPEDKDRVLAFTEKTWEDGDYIKDVSAFLEMEQAV